MSYQVHFSGVKNYVLSCISIESKWAYAVRSSLVCCLEKFSIFAWFCVFICSVVCLFHAMQSYCNLQAPGHREQHFIIGGFVGKQHFSPSIERKAYTSHEKAATPHLINCAHFYIAVYSIPPLSYRIVSIHLEELWFIVVYTNIVRKRVYNNRAKHIPHFLW